MDTASTNEISPVLPSLEASMRSAADQHHAIAKEYERLADAHYTRSNELEELANRQVRIDSDPEFAQRIREAEDQVVGDELLMEAQTPNQSKSPPQSSTTTHRTVKHA